MWKSWGDKWDIVPHDDEKRPRKVRNYQYVVIAIMLIFVITGRLIFLNMQTEAKFFSYIPFIAGVLLSIACIILFCRKWKKNDKECDLSLALCAIVCSVATCLLIP